MNIKLHIDIGQYEFIEINEEVEGIDDTLVERTKEIYRRFHKLGDRALVIDRIKKNTDVRIHGGDNAMEQLGALDE